MSNPANNGNLTGRLAKDVFVYDNQDGSKTVQGTLMVRNNYKSRDGEVKSRDIDFSHYVPAAAVKSIGVGGWALTGKGDQIQFTYELNTNHYTDRNGVEQHKLQAEVTEFPQLLESASVTKARREQNEKKNAANQSNQGQAAASETASEPKKTREQLEAELAELRGEAGGEEPPF